jgi:hypothetical protein
MNCFDVVGFGAINGRAFQSKPECRRRREFHRITGRNVLKPTANRVILDGVRRGSWKLFVTAESTKNFVFF